MDLKEPGNRLVLVGETADELGGSHFCLVNNIRGGLVPRVNAQQAPAIFRALHGAIQSGLVRSCHDLSEGGLATAVAEMAFAGGVGANIRLDEVPTTATLTTAALLFSESNTRFLVEVEPQHVAAFTRQMQGIPHADVGEAVKEPELTITDAAGRVCAKSTLDTLKEAWQAPLRDV
jgi:phosphoribosylformylglycinamidine synthase